MSGLGDLVREIFSLDPSAPALEFEGRWRSWGDLAAIGKAIETALTDAGLGRDARVGAILRNRPECAGALIHLLASDRCIVTLNPMLPGERLAGDIADLKPPAVLALEEDWKREELRAAAKRIGCLGLALTGDPAEPVRVIEGLGEPGLAGVRAFADEDVAVEMLTSGTTGPPKRVPLKRVSIERSVLGAGVFDGRKPGEAMKLRDQVVLVSAPFTHIAGIFNLMNAVLAGRKVALLERFTVEGWAGAVERHRLKVASAPPAALRMIYDAEVPKERLASLAAFRSGTAPLDPNLADALYERYSIPVLVNYSATEFAGAGAGWTLADFREHYPAKRGSVGRVNPGIEARIVDAGTFEPLAPGQQGLLELRAPHLGDGKSWMRTTDLAVLDEDGFLFIRGRADNAIIRGGFKVFPEDIVRELEAHPAIREAAAVDLPDERLGEVPVAAFVASAGRGAPTEHELKAMLRGRLAAYQVPVHIFALEELPRTPSLKVSQPELKAILAKMVAGRQAG